MNHKSGTTNLVGIVLSVLLCPVGCGGPAPAEPQSGIDATSDDGDLELTPRRGGMQVEGTLGTIPEHKVERAFDNKMEYIAECYSDALDDLDVIEGQMDLALKVDLDGSPFDVYVRRSDLGSLQMEACILKRVKAIRFPKPGGGIAVVSHSLSFEPPYDPPEPHPWSSARVQSTFVEHSEAVTTCLDGRTGVDLTLYIDAAGQVVSVGGCAANYAAYPAVSCLASAVQSWTFSPAESEVAKVTVSF